MAADIANTGKGKYWRFRPLPAGFHAYCRAAALLELAYGAYAAPGNCGAVEWLAGMTGGVDWGGGVKRVSGG